jgi:hypothetical protein
MQKYVSISINRKTYLKLQTVANRLKQPKLKVVDMAMDKFFESDEERAKKFHKKLDKIWANVKLPKGKKVRLQDIRVEDAYL